MEQNESVLSEEITAKVFQAKRELQSIIDCVGDLLIQIDNNGVVTRCNLAFTRLTGLSFPQIIGQKLAELMRIGGFQIDSACERTARGYRHLPSARIFCARRYPIPNEHGERPGLVVAFQDITELQNFTHELEQRNQELTATYNELKHSHARLLQQEKLAAIGQLAAGVAHEINNPAGFVASNLGTMAKYMRSIKEFIAGQQQLLEQASGGREPAAAGELRKRLKLDLILEDAVDLLQESRDGVERIKVIVQNLKNFSRVDQARYTPTNINQCLDETLQIIDNELRGRSEVVKNYQQLPELWCHPQQLNQVFLNMLLNASQAIEAGVMKGNGKIAIKTWHNRDSIFITITDNGPGISQEHLSRLFEPFFTTKEPGKGTGLGLSISHDIVAKHGGEITGASAPGVGTTFRIRLPIREKEENSAT